MMKLGVLRFVLYLARSPPNEDGTREGNHPPNDLRSAPNFVWAPHSTPDTTLQNFAKNARWRLTHVPEGSPLIVPKGAKCPCKWRESRPLSPVLDCSSLAHGNGGGKIASPLLLLLMTKGDLSPPSPCCFCSLFHFDQCLMAISFIFST